MKSNEIAYHTTMSILKSWITQGLIKADEYAFLKEELEQKYHPKLSIMWELSPCYYSKEE